jgi:hypothetical protein
MASLYNLQADPTENTASNNPSIVVMDGCQTGYHFHGNMFTKPLLRNGCLSAFCRATAVLVVHFEVSAQQQVYTPNILIDKRWHSSVLDV